jgi:ribosomal-protein-alanine N-acetyltransferase
MRKIVSRSNRATWISKQDGEMGGFAIAQWARWASGYIQTIEVAPGRRKQGIGRELLRRIKDSARAASVRAIWLHVHAENAPATRLYVANSYGCEGREEAYYAPGHAALPYGKPLDSEPAN